VALAEKLTALPLTLPGVLIHSLPITLGKNTNRGR
jgi:hypothetical protein